MIVRRAATAVLFALALAGPAAAQGYGEQRTLQFRLQGADHTTQEVYRYQNSTAAIAAKKAANTGTVGSSGSLNTKSQTGSDLNNVVQYYDYSTSNVSLNGSGNNVSGSVLNAGQDSKGTNQVLNNQTDSASGQPQVLVKP
jgi:hypothetical protein